MSLIDTWEDFKDELLDRRNQVVARWGRKQQRLPARDEANFLRQLSLMIEAGIPFVGALEVLAETMQGNSAELAQELANDLHHGHSLSRSFWRSQDKLSIISPPLVEAGEACGGLTKTLQIAAQWAELAADLRAKLKAALTYPFFVLVVNLALAAVMLAYVFPAFLPLFEGEDLPWLTRFFVALSGVFSSKLFWVVAVLAALEAVVFAGQSEHLVKAHRVALHVPCLGPLLRSSARTKFCAVLAVTSRAGLPLMQAMALAAKASGDPEFCDLDLELQREVRAGAPISEHFLAHSSIYGTVLSHGMALCQETGSTEVVCSHLTHLFQGETDLRVEQLQALLEPLLIVLVSLTTATLLLSIYWPLGKFLQNLVA